MPASWLEAFVRLPAGDRSLLVRSILVLGAARVTLWLLPLRVVRRLLARVGRRPAPEEITPERIGWAIDLARRIVPRATCLPQALAGEALLAYAGHPAELRIGVIKSGERKLLEAHAWVESEGRIVVGDLPQGLTEYTFMPPLPGPRD